MTLNERIAKVLGWKEYTTVYGTVQYEITKEQFAEHNRMADSISCGWHKSGDHYIITDLPNWSGDLNLMHELEMGLTDGERRHYEDLIVKQYMWGEGDYFVFDVITPDAPTRAEAWLKVKGGRNE